MWQRLAVAIDRIAIGFELNGCTKCGDLGRLDPGAEILRIGPNMTSIETTGRLAPFPARW
jgi:hypothetical protein